MTLFEAWGSVQDVILGRRDAADRLRSVRVFYAEQFVAGHTHAWLDGRETNEKHELSAVIARLRTRWQPNASWPRVVSSLSSLIRRHAGDEKPSQLLEAAALAAMCRGWSTASALAQEALAILDGEVTPLRSHAWRLVGAAMSGRGQAQAAVAALEKAIAIAARVGDVSARVWGLADLGALFITEQRFAEAEDVLRAALALATGEHADFRATLRHNLAVALMFQDACDDALREARLAFELRSDASSVSAVKDRDLLGAIVARRGLARN